MQSGSRCGGKSRQMYHLMILLLILMMLIFPICVAAAMNNTATTEKVVLANDPNEAFYGDWAVSQVALYSRVSAAEEFARKSLGPKVILAPDKAVVYNECVSPVFYYKVTLSEREMSEIFRVNTEEMGIVFPSVRIVISEKMDGKWRFKPGFFIIDQNTLLMGTEGVWFELKRIL